jgi:hypothetical protein
MMETINRVEDQSWDTGVIQIMIYMCTGMWTYNPWALLPSLRDKGEQNFCCLVSMILATSGVRAEGWSPICQAQSLNNAFLPICLSFLLIGIMINRAIRRELIPVAPSPGISYELKS